MDNTIYDYYIAIDWAQENMAIARMTKKSNKIRVIDVPSDIKELQVYLENLSGKKVLVTEETTVSQWLYTELHDYVDKIIICDPHRNKLLSEGPKDDKIDARKLVHLLKSGLIKEVYHSTERFIYLRRLVSGYEDLIKAVVRLKNQRSALLRACGEGGKKKSYIKIDSRTERYVLECLERQINLCEKERSGYEKEFKKLSRKYPEIKKQMSIPGIGLINAVKIVARVVTPFRFSAQGKYHSYCGLIKHEKMSGGRSYGKRNPRYCRQLKSVYKSGVLAAIAGNNQINDYYEHLIKEKGYPVHNARNKASRKLATISLGVFKSGKKYQPYRRDKQRDTISK